MLFRSKAGFMYMVQKIRNKFISRELCEDDEDDEMDEILEKMSY